MNSIFVSSTAHLVYVTLFLYVVHGFRVAVFCLKCHNCGTKHHLLELFCRVIEYEIFGEGSHILTNQKRDKAAFSLLIG